MALTLSMVRGVVSKVLGVAPTDTRVVEYVNAAAERLLFSGKWKGTKARYRVCVNQGCLTWPRSIETIEAWALCNQPGHLRNEWFEFLEAGPGVQEADCGCAGTQMIDRGEACAFDDIVGTGKKIAIYADGNEDTDATILLQYYDLNANKVRTSFNGVMIEGERIQIPAAGNYAYSSLEAMPGGLYRVIKPVTRLPIRLYEYAIVGGALKALAYYEPDEELPEYRRSLVPGLRGGGGDCDKVTVTIVGKMRFIPVSRDDDFILIQHKEALRLMVQAVKKSEDNMITEAVTYEAEAQRLLQDQLSHYQGSGETVPIRIVHSEIYGGGSVINLQ